MRAKLAGPRGRECVTSRRSFSFSSVESVSVRRVCVISGRLQLACARSARAPGGDRARALAPEPDFRPDPGGF